MCCLLHVELCCSLVIVRCLLFFLSVDVFRRMKSCAGCCLLRVGYCLLLVACWLLVVGGRVGVVSGLEGVSCWSFVVGCCWGVVLVVCCCVLHVVAC